MNEVEQLVIKNLLLDEEYVRKAMPFIKTEYFADTTGKKLFNVLSMCKVLVYYILKTINQYEYLKIWIQI